MTLPSLSPVPSKFSKIEDIFKDETKRALLTNMVDEDLKCQTHISTQKTHRRAIREAAVEELNIDPRLFAEYAKAAFDNDYAKRHFKTHQSATLIDLICDHAGVALE